MAEPELLTVVCDECQMTLVGLSIPDGIQVTVSYRHIPDGIRAEHPLTLETSTGDYAEWLAIEWDKTPLRFDKVAWQAKFTES